MSDRKSYSDIVAAVCIVTIGLLLALPKINDFPAYIHAWAQADWYSMAIGFQNNGFDFFHPETLIYNKQFPDWWLTDNGSVVTSADFPIHVYIVALLMKTFGTTAPWVFRTWTLICSLVGMWFLYLLVKRLTSSTLKSLAVVIIAITSPLYANYFNGFLPSIPAITLIIIGLWSYARYIQEESNKFWHLAIAMLGLATLIRTSQAVALVAVCCFELLRSTDYKKILKLLPSVIITCLFIIGYMLWNAHLRAQYGSLFLNELMPPRNWNDVDEAFESINDLWKFRYFSQLQHWVILLLATTAIIMFFIRKKKLHRSSLLWFTMIYLFGAVLFFIAMIRQYNQHDYYFLDSFYLPILIGLAIALRQLPKPGKCWAAGVSALLVVGCVVMFNTAKKGLDYMHYEPDRARVCAENYAGSEAWLDDIGIGKDAKILTMFAYPQNLPFILMNRKGYTLMFDDEKTVNNVIGFDYDYIIIEDEVFNNKFEQQKHVLSHLERIDGNGKISLCMMRDTIQIKDFNNERDPDKISN
ncbi:MAG: glycosyltransferase family 39 protein [Bacteroidales bacterium]|nr:glycosyltransferase family 39 protein [Bacteroidales bacterium]